jgi:hypothetical protein
VNLFLVGHNASEVVAKYGQSHSGGKPDLIHSRIVSGPDYAKPFLTMLSGSMEQYEPEFGAISDVTSR